MARDAQPQSAQSSEAPAASTARAPGWATRVLRSQRGRPTRAKPLRWSDSPYPFVHAPFGPTLFPTEDFRECGVRTLARGRLPFWPPDFETCGAPVLLAQIRTRMLPRRGVLAQDGEAENLYAGEPMPAPKRLDTDGRLVYGGSISRSLSPALQLGFIVAQREVIEELRSIRHETAGALRTALPRFRFHMPQGGASIWVAAPSWIDPGALAGAARRHGVLVEPGIGALARAAAALGRVELSGTDTPACARPVTLP